jgi:uncharacterized membrane protein YbjE (DUF340 family)
MIIVLLLMLAGIIAGFALNRYPKVIQLNDKLTSLAIYVLLFLLGISVGLNKTIIQNLDKIGLQAFIITIGAISGSVFALYFVYRFVFKTRQTKGDPHEK